MSQKEQILEFLQDGEKITPLEALELFGCNRLASRIDEIRKDGFPIVTEMISVPTRHGKTRVARYSMGRRETEFAGSFKGIW